MRLADGPTTEVETDIAASPEAVWAVVTDIDLPSRFSSELQGATWLDGADGPAVGARFTGRNRHAVIGEWQTTCTVVACEPPAVFAWAVNDADHPAASWRFDLVATAEGTRLRQWARLGPGPSGLTPAIAARPDKEEAIIAHRLAELQANMSATVEGIKAVVERATADDEGDRRSG